MLLFLLLLDVTHVRPEPKNDPEFMLWSTHRAGSWVKMKRETESAGNRVEAEQTHTLIEIHSDRALIETTGRFHVAGNSIDVPSSRRTVFSKARGNFFLAGTVTRISFETIEVSGMTLRCRVVESTVEQNGFKTCSKVWMCRRVPGGVARMESKTQGAVAYTVTLVATAWGTK